MRIGLYCKHGATPEMEAIQRSLRSGGHDAVLRNADRLNASDREPELQAVFTDGVGAEMVQSLYRDRLIFAVRMEAGSDESTPEDPVETLVVREGGLMSSDKRTAADLDGREYGDWVRDQLDAYALFVPSGNVDPSAPAPDADRASAFGDVRSAGNSEETKAKAEAEARAKDQAEKERRAAEEKANAEAKAKAEAEAKKQAGRNS